MAAEKKIVLSEREMPATWYNIAADVDLPYPMLEPNTFTPIRSDALSRVFPENIIEQEMSTQRDIAIPEKVRELYAVYRPTPLIRATFLEQALGVRSKLYFKYEGVSPSGSHKTNSAIPQAYYNSLAGTKRITTETGAGQWGTALAYACELFNMECVVYMVKVSYNMKAYRRDLMRTYGASVYPSPSAQTEVGRKFLKEDPNTRGSLGIAISEAVEDALLREDTKYSLGSVLNHVCLHQTIIGEEAKAQFAKTNDYPDTVISCVGGGTNFAGIAFPFIKEKLDGKDITFIAVEPMGCPTLTRGKYAYDYGDSGHLLPLVPMYTLGSNFMPNADHAGGLRFHGAGTYVSKLVYDKIITPVAYHQTDVFEAGILFAKTEGYIPAPESAHSIKGAIEEALRAEKEGTPRTILFNVSGHGFLDMTSYEMFLNGEMTNTEPTDEAIAASVKDLKPVVQ